MSIVPAAKFGRFQLALFGMFEVIVSKLCSKHGKRILFISSLYVRVTQLERMNAEVVSKLNQVMAFKINREDSVHLPAALSDIVWRGTDIGAILTSEMMNQIIDEERALEVSERIVDIAPTWFRYDRSEMLKDVSDLISNGRVLASA